MHVRSTLVAGLILGFVAVSIDAVSINGDVVEGMSAPVHWEDSRLDDRVYADVPNQLTYQLNSKRYSVPYHPVARLRSNQNSGVVLPYAMIANRNYVNDDGNRCKIQVAAQNFLYFKQHFPSHFNAELRLPVTIDNSVERIWKPTAAELLSALVDHRRNVNGGTDNANFMRFGISKRKYFDDVSYDD